MADGSIHDTRFARTGEDIASKSARRNKMSPLAPAPAKPEPAKLLNAGAPRPAAPPFIEELYLALNPDVAAAIAAGTINDARSHWESCGARETIEGSRPSLQNETNYSRIPPRATPESEAQHLDTKAYLYFNPDVQRAVGEDPNAVRYHWIHHGRFEQRRAPGIAPFRHRRMSLARMGAKPFGLNVFGPFMAKTGLGTAARNMLAAIKETQLPFEVWNFDTSQGPARFADIDRQRRPRYNANIVFANADQVEHVFNEAPDGFFDDSYTIGVWQWELASFRPDWFSAFGAVDEVWTNSRFQLEAIRAVAPVPVINISLPVVTPAAPAGGMSRADIGIKDSDFVFLLPFDVGSTIARKNPLAGVEAFRTAFGGRDDVVLIVKYQSPEHDRQFLLKLSRAIAGAANIHVMAETLNEADMASLRAISDCLLAPHRSEGFGLNIAEFMALGKPVVATNYAGNVDFLDAATGYPVAYDLCEIETMTGPYPAKYIWAEPRRDALVAQLREVFSNRAEAKRRGAQAAKRMAEHFTPSRISWDIIARLRRAELDRPLPAFARYIGASSSTRAASPFRPLGEAPGRQVPNLALTPHFSIILPVYNVPSAYLERCIQSVLNQSYPFWELCIANDASTAQDTLAMLHRYRGLSAQIKIVDLVKNEGIAGASNRAAALATGDYVAMLDNDDELEPNALAEMAAAINAAPELDCLYCDETKIDEAGREIDHFYKPDWSPEHLESVMYVLHMLVVRKKLFFEIGQFRAEFDGAQDYDLMLRISRATDKIGHVPKSLYKWRAIEGSAALKVDAKPKALDSGFKALREHVAEKFGPAAKVEKGLIAGTFRVRRNLGQTPPVSLMILTNNGTAELPGRGKVKLVENFVRSIKELTLYPNYKLIVVDNSSLSKAQVKKFEDDGVQVINFEFTGTFNFAAKANFAVRAARTEMIVLLNDDMEVISPDWLGALMEYAQDPEIGVVGARLLRADGSVQHVGAVIGVNEGVAHVYHNADRNFIGYNGFTHIIRNYSAVTGACFATRKSVVMHAGGFDTSFATDFNDVDLCLKIRDAGYRIVYTPYCELYHFEGQSIIRNAQSEDERSRFSARWAAAMAHDPFYNVNLSRNRLDFARA
jgi:GT2 family glycosyltransferase/glycosyltransferase involved in cell wall biosynthesis